MVAATLYGSSMRIAVSRGCPRGDVLSPILWCLVVDYLIAGLSEGENYIQRYANDTRLLVVGKFRDNTIGPSNRRDMV